MSLRSWSTAQMADTETKQWSQAHYGVRTDRLTLKSVQSVLEILRTRRDVDVLTAIREAAEKVNPKGDGEYATLRAITRGDNSMIDYAIQDFGRMEYYPKLTISDVVKGVQFAAATLREDAAAQRSVNAKAIEILQVAHEMLADPVNQNATWLSPNRGFFNLLSRARAAVIKRDTGTEIPMIERKSGTGPDSESPLLELWQEYGSPSSRAIDSLRNTVPHADFREGGWYSRADAAMAQGQEHALSVAGRSIRQAIAAIEVESAKVLPDTTVTIGCRTLSETVRDALWVSRHLNGFPKAREPGIRFTVTAVAGGNFLDAGYQLKPTAADALDLAEQDVWADEAMGVFFAVQQDEVERDGRFRRRPAIEYTRAGKDTVRVRVTGADVHDQDHLWQRSQPRPEGFRDIALAALTGKQVRSAVRTVPVVA
jgi:hypothetical protein